MQTGRASLSIDRLVGRMGRAVPEVDLQPLVDVRASASAPQWHVVRGYTACVRRGARRERVELPCGSWVASPSTAGPARTAREGSFPG
jgi:hypothetical protein